MSDVRKLVLEEVAKSASDVPWSSPRAAEPQPVVFDRGAGEPTANAPARAPSPSRARSPLQTGASVPTPEPSVAGAQGGGEAQAPDQTRVARRRAPSQELFEEPRRDLLAVPPPGSRSILPADSVPSPSAEEQRAFCEAAAELAVARLQALSEVEGQLLDLAVVIAEVMIESELQSAPSLHENLVKAALRTLGESKEAVLRVSPDAYSVITASSGRSTQMVDGINVRVELDNSLSGLGCVAENSHRRVIGTVSERLKETRRLLDLERASEEES